VSADTLTRGYTVSDVARRYRVARKRVREWIRRGRLAAINTADPLHRPRWVVTPDALVKFERGRQATPMPKPTRRRKRTDLVDYFPD
jgi:transposase-like protein